MDAERPLPHNLDAERAVLGAALSDAEALRHASVALVASDFFLPEHKVIFTRALTLDAARHRLGKFWESPKSGF